MSTMAYAWPKTVCEHGFPHSHYDPSEEDQVAETLPPPEQVICDSLEHQEAQTSPAAEKLEKQMPQLVAYMKTYGVEMTPHQAFMALCAPPILFIMHDATEGAKQDGREEIMKIASEALHGVWREEKARAEQLENDGDKVQAAAVLETADKFHKSFEARVAAKILISFMFDGLDF